MASKTGFGEIFSALRDILARHASLLDVKDDSADCYYLDTAHIMKNGKPLYFGSVRIRKNYVSYHLMPVYVEPALLRSASSKLKKRMQGKSCFNFTHMDEELFGELAELTERGLKYYRSEGYLDK